MKSFVTGINGMPGHDIVAELSTRGYDGICSDIQPALTAAPGEESAATKAYYPLAITDPDAV